jgi:7-cyano-7-deazaguanine synthase
MKKIILLSGGLDSATLLAKEADNNTVALFFNYGQKAITAEQSAVIALAQQYGVSIIIRDISEIFKTSPCTLLSTSKEDPVSFSNTELEFRNGIFISCAISLAMQLFPNEEVLIMLGLIQIRVPYADCSQDFVQLYNSIAEVCSKGRIKVLAPFIKIGKDKVLEEALRLKLDVHKTWSCYSNKENPCGVCDACIDRKILGVL